MTCLSSVSWTGLLANTLNACALLLTDGLRSSRSTAMLFDCMPDSCPQLAKPRVSRRRKNCSGASLLVDASENLRVSFLIPSPLLTRLILHGLRLRGPNLPVVVMPDHLANCAKIRCASLTYRRQKESPPAHTIVRWSAQFASPLVNASTSPCLPGTSR